jgi:hypothetical protein
VAQASGSPGVLDHEAGELLALAFGEAIRLDGGAAVRVPALRFIDAPCVRLILDAAAGLTRSARSPWKACPGSGPGSRSAV